MDLLKQMAEKQLGQKVQLEPLVGDGSDRIICRLRVEGQTIIGIYHENLEENRDFLLFTKEMAAIGLPVPKILQVAEDEKRYLLEDLGPNNLAQQMDIWRDSGENSRFLNAYHEVLHWLPLMQVGMAHQLGVHLKNRVMDKNQLISDLIYFETNYIKLFGYESDYTDLVKEELYSQVIEPIAQLEGAFFVYRDFQARNFMWHQEKIYFIDYQSGMLGNKYYDLASMLYASRSGLSEKQRTLLLYHAFQKIGQGESKAQFEENFYLVLLLRRFRSLGSYGFLGQVKKKSGFLESIAPSLREMKGLFEKRAIQGRFPQTAAMIDQFIKKQS